MRVGGEAKQSGCMATRNAITGYEKGAGDDDKQQEGMVRSEKKGETGKSVKMAKPNRVARK